jgi:protein-disulfide isomerase
MLAGGNFARNLMGAAVLAGFSLMAHAQTPAAPAAASAPLFAAPGAENFSAASPTKETVESFLKASWGYDTDRLYQVFAVEKTPATGISRVVVQVAQKSDPQHQVAVVTFLVTPDGQHLITNNLEMLTFGAHPYTEAARILQERAKGPSRGAADKKLELVEFADFQCPHCKAAQPTIDRLLRDYPNAHFVFQNFPLVNIHSEAYKAASYGACVVQLGGNEAFFKFADAAFANQDNLTPQTSDAALGDAVTKAGLDAAKVGSCTYTQAAKAVVDASVQLAQQLNVNETPSLFVNGRLLPFSAVVAGQLPYETLKQIIDYQLTLGQ